MNSKEWSDIVGVEPDSGDDRLLYNWFIDKSKEHPLTKIMRISKGIIKMKVLCVTENEDGSAVVEIDMSQEELRLVIEIGFTKMLTDGMETFENVLNPKSTTISSEEKRSDSKTL